MSAILTARELRKRYRGVTAVDGLNLDIEEGSCLGLLGPNGAGKSTTIEMLEGLLQPSSGEIRFRGRPLDQHYRERVGIQFQNTALQDFLTVRENLQFFAALYKRRRSLDELIAGCHLEEYLDRDHRRLSGGQRQRMLLAIALINDPDLVFLDEPTTGLDPQARRNFWELVQDVRRRGKTVLLTTHYMDEAYELSDDIAIMDRGRIVARGSPQQLLSEHFSDSVLELPAAEIKGREQELSAVTRGDAAEILSADVNKTVQKLLAAGVSLAQLKIRPRTLEDLFISLTGRELRA
ncbi:ABC-2 type transport system ATP-binding protein [Solimonas aquatica]|uniref:ABC-2 type transport system ATP-binding protein n=1 Tax=Solimonas aquatica TaxID=489703 RepID=A0A1H9CVX4_9GAMM|nr:ABC transporter ATP-binding protein [Solimonas aquatica]SEQ05370.1 ABC-2 type transport system ATP-binding protein [Solimonas aquatica]